MTKEQEMIERTEKSQGLPELQGTEKQVAWAKKLRFEMLQMGDENITTQKQMDGFENILLDETSAKWYIDHRMLKVSEMLQVFESRA